jgi:hypothetical protein
MDRGPFKREKLTQEARHSVVLSQEAAETHQLMALPFIASSNPTIVKIRDVNSQFTHSHLVNIPQNVGPNQHRWFSFFVANFSTKKLGNFGN